MCVLQRKSQSSRPNHSGNSGLRTNFSSCGLLCSRMFLSIIVVISLFVDTSKCVRFLGEKETFARYPKWNACNNASIMFEFRTTQPDGLLMYTNYHGERNSIQVCNCLVKGIVFKIHVLNCTLLPSKRCIQQTNVSMYTTVLSDVFFKDLPVYNCHNRFCIFNIQLSPCIQLSCHMLYI